MSQEWVRLTMARKCGGCGALIRRGELGKLYVIGAIKKIRCAACDGPAPPVPDGPIETKPAPVRLDLARFGFLPLDREPGEDG